jgi:hypothetical protein
MSRSWPRPAALQGRHWWRRTPIHSIACGRTARRLRWAIDSGGQYLDGTTDITRTVAVGTPERGDARPLHRVLKGHIAIARLRFPKGTTAPTRRLRPPRAVAGRARLRPRHRPRRRQLSLRPRGPGAHFEDRPRGARARHDPVQRARLLPRPAPTASASRTWSWSPSPPTSPAASGRCTASRR